MVSGPDWPSIGWEERAWTPRIPSDLVSAAVRRRHVGPYRAAVVPLIGGRNPILPNDVLALAEEASLEIARFDAELGAEVAPFASVLLRSESTSSSKIENLTSGAMQIMLAELGSTEKRNAREIVGNVAAMKAALNLADRLDADAILAMHTALVGEIEPAIAGRWRDEQVWIGGDSFGPHGATFVPPHHDQVPELASFMKRPRGWLSMVNVVVSGANLYLLIKAAMVHYQFETIHPFPDGNGRTGRALIHAMLRGHGLTRNVTVPVSAGLLTNTDAYFSSLMAYRDGDAAAIVEKLAEASFAATANGRQLVQDLREIRTAWDDKVVARRGATAWRLADVLVRQPVVDTSVVANELGVTPQNALRAIAPLADVGILTEFTGFKRNRMWQSREVLTALDEFAARAGRRH